MQKSEPILPVRNASGGKWSLEQAEKALQTIGEYIDGLASHQLPMTIVEKWEDMRNCPSSDALQQLYSILLQMIDYPSQTSSSRALIEYGREWAADTLLDISQSQSIQHEFITDTSMAGMLARTSSNASNSLSRNALEQQTRDFILSVLSNRSINFDAVGFSNVLDTVAKVFSLEEDDSLFIETVQTLIQHEQHYNLPSSFLYRLYDARVDTSDSQTNKNKLVFDMFDDVSKLSLCANSPRLWHHQLEKWMQDAILSPFLPMSSVLPPASVFAHHKDHAPYLHLFLQQYLSKHRTILQSARMRELYATLPNYINKSRRHLNDIKHLLRDDQVHLFSTRQMNTPKCLSAITALDQKLMALDESRAEEEWRRLVEIPFVTETIMSILFASKAEIQAFKNEDIETTRKTVTAVLSWILSFVEMEAVAHIDTTICSLLSDLGAVGNFKEASRHLRKKRSQWTSRLLIVKLRLVWCWLLSGLDLRSEESQEDMDAMKSVLDSIEYACRQSIEKEQQRPFIIELIVQFLADVEYKWQDREYKLLSNYHMSAIEWIRKVVRLLDFQSEEKRVDLSGQVEARFESIFKSTEQEE